MYIIVMDEIQNLELCITAAKNAGEFLYKNKNQLNKTHSAIGRDIKLLADTKSENLIIEFLQNNSNYPILGEEAGKSDELGEIYWVVDPLDGTANFARNIPICCVSIALVHNHNPVLGAIYDFNNSDIYYGSVNKGAYLNKNKINVSKIADQSQATLITGLPVNTDYSSDSMLTLINDFKNWKKIRMLGSAAMAAAYVASGKVDTYKESGTNLWDVAAGVAIVRAAGGAAIISNMQEDFSLDIHMSNSILKA